MGDELENEVKQQMDRFYNIDENVDQISTFVGNQMKNMPKGKLSESVQKFGLCPIEEYLDKETLRNNTKAIDMGGYIRYLDTYLLEMSGGKRTELLKVGKKLVDHSFLIFSTRLLRTAIISEYFSKL